MRRKHWIFPLIGLVLLIFITGCMKQDPTYEPTNNQPLNLTKLSTKGITDQQPADEAKQFLSHYEEVSGVRAVNHNGKIMVAIEIDQDDRFSLKNIESKLQKELMQNFSKMEVDVSTDQKILFELEKLENEITNKSISKKDINKRMKKLRKLMKEQT